MATTFDTVPVRRADRAIIAGRILSGLVILFLAADALGKLIAPATMIAYSPPLGLPADPGLYRLLGTNLEALTHETEFILDAGTYQSRQLASVRVPGALVSEMAFTL